MKFNNNAYHNRTIWMPLLFMIIMMSSLSLSIILLLSTKEVTAFVIIIGGSSSTTTRKRHSSSKTINKQQEGTHQQEKQRRKPLSSSLSLLQMAASPFETDEELYNEEVLTKKTSSLPLSFLENNNNNDNNNKLPSKMITVLLDDDTTATISNAVNDGSCYDNVTSLNYHDNVGVINTPSSSLSSSSMLPSQQPSSIMLLKIDEEEDNNNISQQITTISSSTTSKMKTTKTTTKTRIKFIPERTRYQALIAIVAIITASNNGLQFYYNTIPVAESLFAMVSSIVIVSLLATIVDNIVVSTSSKSGSLKIPKFHPNSERFNQNTFIGRFLKMFLSCDPRLLLYNEKEVRMYDTMITNYINYDDNNDNNENNENNDRMLWEAKRIVDSALHPQTKQWIPRAFRMSGYLPFNGPICVAMVASSSISSLLFWSWLNQSQNALVNYFNRSSSSSSSSSGGGGGDDSSNNNIDNDNDDDNITLLKSYVCAVGSALIISFGLEQLVHHYQSLFDSNIILTEEQITEIERFISFPSAVIASSLNCYVIRSNEINNGIPLYVSYDENNNNNNNNNDYYDEEDNNNNSRSSSSRSRSSRSSSSSTNKRIMVLPNERSKVAAKRGVYGTVMSRAILQLPTFFIPPLILNTVQPLKDILTNNPSLDVPITTFLLLISFGVGLPCVIGLLPQWSKISVNDVESPYNDLGYDEFYYDKGL